jgi:ketosteroid isomerase-like protein
MTSHGNDDGARILREGHRAFNDRDREALMEVIAEDVTWHVRGNSPITGTLHGRDEVWERFFAPFWEAPARVEDHDILASDEHVAALSEIVFDLPDGERRWEAVEVCHFDDGRITERWLSVDRRAEVDAFIEQMMAQT